MDKTNITQNHPFYFVDSSPWPLIVSLGALFITFGGVMYMHLYKNGSFLFLIGLFTIIYVMYCWLREKSFVGQHTKIVQHGLRIGMILFIISEIMFFWAFFHFSLSPAPTIGGVWPPIGIEILNLWEIPLLNTILLLSSGGIITLVHYLIVAGNKKQNLWFSYTFLNIFKHYYVKIIKKKRAFYNPNLSIKNKLFAYGGVTIPSFLSLDDCFEVSVLIKDNTLENSFIKIQEVYSCPEQYGEIAQFLTILKKTYLLDGFIKCFNKDNSLYDIEGILYLGCFNAGFLQFIIFKIKNYPFNLFDEGFWSSSSYPSYFSEKNKKDTVIFFNTLQRMDAINEFTQIWS